jgi:hypothetical protein
MIVRSDRSVSGGCSHSDFWFPFGSSQPGAGRKEGPHVRSCRRGGYGRKSAFRFGACLRQPLKEHSKTSTPTLVNICGFPSVLSAVVSAVRKPIQESDPKNACGCYFRPLVALASESRSQVIVCESDHAKLQMTLCAGGTNTCTTVSNQPLLAATYLQAATTSPLTGRTQSIRD